MALYAQTGSLQTYDAVEAAGPGVLVPDAHLMFTGDYSRAGSDLVLTGSDGAKFHVTGYFNTDTPPSLVSPDGAKLPGDVVMSLAGPQFPGQYAQAADASGGKAAIGKVESSNGSASAVRTDGTTVVLKAGDPVFQGDVVLTGPGSKLGISFVDGTIFSLSANARMVLNSLVYDADAGQNNSMLFSLVEGSFVFAAGQIAPTGDMKIQTPVATMGIRGTTPTINIDSETGEVNFSIVADLDDGHVGTYTLYNLDNGLPIGTVSTVGTKWQLKSANGQIAELDKTEADLLNDANAVGQLNTIYTQWQNSTQQNPDGPQAGPENNSPPSGGLNTNPQNPDAPGADGNTGNQGGDGEGDGQPAPQGNEQQSGTPPPPPPTDTNNDLPLPPPPTEASGPNLIFGTPDPDNLPGTASADVIDGLAGDDTIDALGGNDIIIIGPNSGVDIIDGGDGIDTILIEGDLNIDTATFQSEVENIEIIDLNKTDHNTFTISGDDVAGGLNDTLQFRGGGDPGDTLNLVNEFIIDEDQETEQSIEGSWQQLNGEIRVIDGIIFDVYEFVDGQNNVLATAEVERGIDVNTVDPEFQPPAAYTGALGANASASESLPVDGANFNSPEPSLSDYWLFYAIAGQEVTVQVGRDESALDPALWLFKGLVDDPSAFGSGLDSGDPGFIDFADDEIPHPGPFGDPTTTFIAPETGFYTAIVTNYISGADDGDGVFPYTIQVSGNADLPGSIPDSNVLSEGFENGFAANGWEFINATISSENSNEGDSSAFLTTATANDETTPDGVRTNAQEVANLVGATLNQLDPLGGDPGFATEGSAIANSFHAMEGQIFSFDWFFSTYEYNEADDVNDEIVNDFAFFVIDGEVFKLFDSEALDSQVDELVSEGWNSFSIAIDSTGHHDIAFGVLDNEDTAVESSLNIDNIHLGPSSDVPHLMGGPGNDILVSGQGENTITTGGGADKIIFGHINDGIDLISDFGSQDTLDITGLLTVAFDPTNPEGFVRATTDGSDTTISVDPDGPGGPAQFADIAVLQSVGDGISINVSIGDEDTFVTSAAIT